jgi:hypothetical protein
MHQDQKINNAERQVNRAADSQESQILVIVDAVRSLARNGVPFNSEGKLVTEPTGYKHKKPTPRYPPAARAEPPDRHSNVSVTHRFL